jgi:hypothetical protein
VDFISKFLFFTGGVSGNGPGVARASSNLGMRLDVCCNNDDYCKKAERWFADQSYKTEPSIELGAITAASVKIGIGCLT